MLVGSSVEDSIKINNASVIGVILPVSSVIKSLGVIIDSRLTFNTHLFTSELSAKCVITAHGRCVIYVIIYHFLLHRHWHAASWNHNWNTVIQFYTAHPNRLSINYREQDMLAQVVINKLWCSHSAELLQSLHWLPVKERIDFKVALLTYKVRNSSTPYYLHCLLTNHVINSITLLSSQNKFYMYRDHKLFVALKLLVLQHPQCGTNFLLISKWLTVLLF